MLTFNNVTEVARIVTRTFGQVVCDVVTDVTHFSTVSGQVPTGVNDY